MKFSNCWTYQKYLPHFCSAFLLTTPASCNNHNAEGHMERLSCGSVKCSQDKDSDFTCHCHPPKTFHIRNGWAPRRTSLAHVEIARQMPNTMRQKAATEWETNSAPVGMRRMENSVSGHLYQQQQHHKEYTTICNHHGLMDGKK